MTGRDQQVDEAGPRHTGQDRSSNWTAQTGQLHQTQLARAAVAHNFVPRLQRPLDERGRIAILAGAMGRRDNRRSMKMRRRTAQRKLKARIAKKRAAGREKAAAGAKPAKKKAAAPKAK
jgi:hypothetical protein